MAGAGLACTSLAATRGIAGVLTNGTHTQAAGEYTGPLFVSFAADGGWDVLMGCDPKPGRSNAYGNVGTAGGISYAPVGNNAAFFNKHAQRTVVINGLDVASNNHEIGRRHIWTGKLDDTHPHIGAMVAGSWAPQLPLSFIAEGSMDETRGVVARTRIDNADVLTDLAAPNEVMPADPADMRTYHTEPASEMIKQWRSDRISAMRETQNLPRVQAALDNIITVRGGANELALLEAYMPETLSENETRRKIQITVAAYKAGLAVAASFRRAGFDTHDNNDAEQVVALDSLLGHVDFLWDEAARQGIDSDLVVAIGSDFARTPTYNVRNGRDHWETTSMMVMGAAINGERTVGASDGGLNAQNIDPVTLQPSSDGVRLMPKHVHRALRDLLGVSDNLEGRFSLQTEELALFG
jgi:hypothetical protein